MLVRHAVLLTPSRSLRPPELPPASRLTKRTPILRTLFQVPYPATPLLATLTKTTGGVYQQFPFLVHPKWNRAELAIRHFQLANILKSFLFTFLRTLLHTEKLNPFIFKRFRTLCTKHPGWGSAATYSKE